MCSEVATASAVTAHVLAQIVAAAPAPAARPAREVVVDGHVIARTKPGDVRPHLGDGAGDLVADDPWQPVVRSASLSAPHDGQAETTSMDPDQRHTRAWLWPDDVLHDQRPANLM